MIDSKKTFDAAHAMFEQALLEGRAEHAEQEVRVAKLKSVAALEQAGRPAEAAALLAEVRAEQKEAGIV